jgi:hypothetical protein
MDFCQASKSPPIFIVENFLVLNGLKSGPHFLRMDQGGELWRSNELIEVAAAAGYAIEPTGSNAASVRFWSATLVHVVYLKNRLYHKALCMTPHEA